MNPLLWVLDGVLYPRWAAYNRSGDCCSCQKGSGVEPECVEAVRSVVQDGSEQEAEVGLALAAKLLDIYRYRYQSIEAFRVNRYGWSGFFSALEAATGQVGFWRSGTPAGGSRSFSTRS